MKRLVCVIPVIVGIALCWHACLAAELTIIAEEHTQQVFGGADRRVRASFQNPSDKVAEANLRIRVHQTSSATTVLLRDLSWKNLRVLPEQTVVESAKVSFPEVNGETLFVVQWVEGSNSVIGKTEVLVYPANVLSELRLLAGEAPLGVFDPQNLLKPLLKTAGVEIADFDESSMESFGGKLVILGPFQSRADMRDGITGRVRELANRGVAVVWLKPPDKRDGMKPDFYTVREGRGAVVVARSGEVKDLAGSPRAQVNLVRLARLAVHPEPLGLPGSTDDQ